MMPQTILPFKLEITQDTITAHAGLALIGEYAHALDLPRTLDRELPGPGSGAGYDPSEFVMPLVVMLHGGGRSLEDLRQIREDAGLRDLLGMESLPSSDATGDWLRRIGAGPGLPGLSAVNRDLLRRGMKRDGLTDYTLDIDATQIVAEKQEAKLTYKGEIGYMPIVGHLAENGLIVGDEFRPGNDAPQSRNLEFIKHCVTQMPPGKRIGNLRADSASYQAAIFNWCEHKDNAAAFAIGADLDAAVRSSIAEIPEGNWRPYQDGHIAETVHSMEKTEKAFRLIVIRRLSQGELFGPDDIGLRYKVIASNREETAEETVAWYNRRGDASENRIKELKIGFGVERMPCGDQEANAAFFRIGVIAYNLFVLFKRDALPADWRRHQVQTIRWQLYQIAGKVVDHARGLALKVRRSVHALFEEIRARTMELAMT
jgi:hypothetical protein